MTTRRGVHTRAKCATCGAAVRAKDRFCATCGTPIAAAQAASVPPSVAVEPARVASVSLQVPALGEAALREQRKVVTILFADLSGSTPLAERLDPEDLRRVLASYFSQLSRQIRRYEGTIDKYIGDAVMAVFGAPLSHEDDAERAIHAALAMHRSIAKLNDDLDREHGVRLALRIGINTGEVVAGMLGGDVQSSYTVVGDAVNTAQRFESVAPLNEVLVSETTRRLALHAFEFETLPPVTLKGKAEPVAAYRVVRRRDEEIEPDASPLVGRREELAFLGTALDDAVAGRGRVLHVRGEAGVGKSRLVTEFRVGLAAGVERMAARCASYETNTPYALIADLVRGAFRIHLVDDEAAARTAFAAGAERLGLKLDENAIPLLLDVIGFNVTFAIDPELKRRLLVLLLRSILQAAGKRSSFVVIAEDLHWIDAASSGMLIELVRDVRSLAGVFITTARPSWHVPWEAEVVDLPALNEQESRTLIDELFEGGVDDVTAHAIIERAGGNPFYIEEVARELRRGGSTLPTTVQEVIEARLDRLVDQTARVVRSAAVIGVSFWYRLLEQLIPQEALAPHLATLEEEAFVVARASTPELTYAFRQALIREVAYQTQLLATRRATHTAVGRAIEVLYGDRLDEFVDLLAYHFERGEDSARALYWLVRAGDRARGLFANTEALVLYTAALRVARDEEGPFGASGILERIGDVQRLTGQYDEARANYETAGKRMPIERPVTRARLLRKTALALQGKGAYPEALATLRAAGEALRNADAPESARITLQTGQVHFWRGEYDDARRELQDAVRAGEAVGADDLVAEGLKLLGNVANNVGDIRFAEDLYRRSRAAYEGLEDVVGVADVRSNLGMIYRRMGRWDDSLEEYRASLAIRERTGHVRGIAASHNNIGEVYRTRGEPAQAIPHYREAIAILERTGGAADAAVVRMSLGAAHVDSGDAVTGLAELRAAEIQVQALGRMKYLPDLYQLIAAGELARGDLVAARENAERSLDLASAAHARHLEATARRVLAEVSIASGDVGSAQGLLEASIRTLEELGEAAELARSRAVLARISG
jgi:adenylate cyclase